MYEITCQYSAYVHICEHMLRVLHDQAERSTTSGRRRRKCFFLIEQLGSKTRCKATLPWLAIICGHVTLEDPSAGGTTSVAVAVVRSRFPSPVAVNKSPVWPGLYVNFSKRRLHRFHFWLPLAFTAASSVVTIISLSSMFFPCDVLRKYCRCPWVTLVFIIDAPTSPLRLSIEH